MRLVFDGWRKFNIKQLILIKQLAIFEPIKPEDKMNELIHTILGNPRQIIYKPIK